MRQNEAICLPDSSSHSLDRLSTEWPRDCLTYKPRQGNNCCTQPTRTLAHDYSHIRLHIIPVMKSFLIRSWRRFMFTRNVNQPTGSTLRQVSHPHGQLHAQSVMQLFLQPLLISQDLAQGSQHHLLPSSVQTPLSPQNRNIRNHQYGSVTFDLHLAGKGKWCVIMSRPLDGTGGMSHKRQKMYASGLNFGVDQMW